jgi:hypothetical protein
MVLPICQSIALQIQEEAVTSANERFLAPGLNVVIESDRNWKVDRMIVSLNIKEVVHT